jgi:hypothetical protein
MSAGLSDGGAVDARWTPALRRAVICVRPEYFAWPLAEREVYGAAIPERDAAEIERLVQKELFGCAIADDALDDDQADRFNEVMLPRSHCSGASGSSTRVRHSQTVQNGEAGNPGTTFHAG